MFAQRLCVRLVYIHKVEAEDIVLASSKEARMRICDWLVGLKSEVCAFDSGWSCVLWLVKVAERDRSAAESRGHLAKAR